MNWLDTLSGYAKEGADIYNSITGTATPASPAATPAVAAPAQTNWLLIGGIGAAVLVVIALLFRK